MLLDIICIVLFVLSLIFGWKHGILRSLISIGIFALSLVLTVLFFEPVSEYILKLPFMQETILRMTQTIEINPDSVLLPQEILHNLSESFASLAEMIITRAITAVIAIVLFFLIKLVLKLTRPFFEKITKLPVIRQIDGLIGLLAGGVLCLFLIMLAFVILSGFSGSPVALWVHEQINSSYIAVHLYEQNIFYSLL